MHGSLLSARGTKIFVRVERVVGRTGGGIPGSWQGAKIKSNECDTLVVRLPRIERARFSLFVPAAIF